MRDILIFLSPVFLLLLFPYVFIFEVTKLLYTMIVDYVAFLRFHYIPTIKETFKKR